MSASPGSPETRLDLALPGAQRQVHEWVAAPANDLGKPPVCHSRLVASEIIYAEHKPLLSGPELLARYCRPSGTTTSAELSSPAVGCPGTGAARHRKIDPLRPAWWGAVALIAAAMSSGAPMI